MKPYKLPDGTWVDLDTIQAMKLEAPYGDEHSEMARIYWLHAFQKEWCKASFDIEHGEMDMSHENQNYWSPIVGDDGESLFMRRVRTTAFEPFFNAWVANGRKAME